MGYDGALDLPGQLQLSLHPFLDCRGLRKVFNVGAQIGGHLVEDLRQLLHLVPRGDMEPGFQISRADPAGVKGDFMDGTGKAPGDEHRHEDEDHGGQEGGNEEDPYGCLLFPGDGLLGLIQGLVKFIDVNRGKKDAVGPPHGDADEEFFPEGAVLFLPEVVTAHGPPVQVLPDGLPEGGELVAKCRQVLPLDGGIGVEEILPVLFTHPVVETAVAGLLDFLEGDLPEFRVADVKGVVPEIYLDLSRQGVGLFTKECLQTPPNGSFHLYRVVLGVFGDTDYADEGEKGREKYGQSAVNENKFGADGHGKRAHNRFLRMGRFKLILWMPFP